MQSTILPSIQTKKAEEYIKQSLDTHPIKKYNTIEYQTRKQLIRRVVKRKEKLADVSIDLGIKLSTCKFIIKSYKKYGRIFKKKALDERNAENSIDLQSEQNQTSNATATCKVIPQYIFYPVYCMLPVYIYGQKSGNSSELSHEMFYWEYR